MRSLLLIALALVSCAPDPSGPLAPLPTAENQPSQIEAASSALRVDPSSASSPTQPTPSRPLVAPTLVRTSLGGISIEAICFDSLTHYLAVVDQSAGPGTQWPDGRSAGKSVNGIAAINAGFFTPEGKPLGRVIADGSSVGAINRVSSLGSGFYVRDAAGAMDLLRRESFKGGHHALQSGPFLIEGSRAVQGLSNKQSSARTFVAYDGQSRWIIARTGACSLASLAQALSGQSIGSTHLKQVLNLDGGRSSEIWASGKVTNGPLFERPFWNKPVRNFLVLKAR
ncbi:phosphodiester glycosidase family protein [Haloferula sp.]|uniref:phosphodiester glycosidase family protein n=1 Tax=Haloferula sp. TaxID=2497595 RepID=UPI003C71BE54